MKDQLLNQRIVQHQADTIKLLWNYDLLCPSKTGKFFSRTGLRVAISQENLDLAQSFLAQGAKDIRFIARRVDAHFVLDSCEIVRAADIASCDAHFRCL
jgi:hypothetical protein